MKKIISLILVLTMCLAFSSCAVNPENYSLALAAKAMEVKHSDSEQEGYEEFIDKLDSFAAKLTYEVYSDSDKQHRASRSSWAQESLDRYRLLYQLS